MLNHYGKTASFTTKIGLCVNMRNLPWYVQANPDSFFPRCYGLCTESEKQEFLVPSSRGGRGGRGLTVLPDDFRRTVASSILKWVVSHQNLSRSKFKSKKEEPKTSDPSLRKDPDNTDNRFRDLPGRLVDAACKVCQAYLGQLEHEDIDNSEEATKHLSEAEWNDLIQQYYSLVHGNAFISNSRSYFSQCQALLSKITSVNPQTEIDGFRNIWIIKPAAKSRGRDIVCMERVENILELVATEHPATKDNKWVVQKYIETPLLIYDTKFDIRQWFLVTDWNPLTIWFYKESYLRFSTQRFSLDNLDSAIHLCNNSIQRRLKNDKERSPLLPGHNMWTSSRFQEYLQKRGRGAAWGSIIYPSMKKAITNAMRVAQDHVEPRKNSFELYGADFILGRDFKPWLIEINSSPTMHPSTPVTAQLCAQVQEDTIKVVVDRKLDRNCDIGNFELLWRQPAVELPPFSGSDLYVEGINVSKAKKPTPHLTTFNLDMLPEAQTLKVQGSWPRPDSVGGPPGPAPQEDWKRENSRASSSWTTLVHQPVERSCRARPAHLRPACNHPRADSKASKSGLAKARLPKALDPSLLSVHPLVPVLQSVKTIGNALSQLPKAPGPLGGGGRGAERSPSRAKDGASGRPAGTLSSAGSGDADASVAPGPGAQQVLGIRWTYRGSRSPGDLGRGPRAPAHLFISGGGRQCQGGAVLAVGRVRMGLWGKRVWLAVGGVCRSRGLWAGPDHQQAGSGVVVAAVGGAGAALPGDLRAPCLVCRGSVPPAGPCKRCRSFCASVLQGVSFVPLGSAQPGSPWSP
ncbi:LOW QUALITY PROTEIN: protein monoglycylase TTLL8 [Perognathus longimembris pacificus]|uniref:LOW QUALITY PROTEIN: protein monoglycylase TTLL8 n=1 Tax=Perognathus longimembris pacificus TaxID=214514 RepID=UPI002018CDE3|nr:LOW QUALITY PROTEIN: protein monoglycylase TTLL8 [Perognathus longimembris pacificus]